MKKKSSLMAVLCLVLTAWPVMAEETEKASSLVEEARALIEAEDYEAAVPILQEAADGGVKPDSKIVRFYAKIHLP